MYGTKHKVRRNEVLNGFQEPALFDQGFGSNFVYDRSTFETELGAVFTSDYQLSLDHKLGARALYNRKSTDEVLDGQGIDHLFDTSKPLFAQSEIYTADQLGFGQIEGHHHFSLGDVDWRAAWSPSLEDQPDSKYARSELEARREQAEPGLSSSRRRCAPTGT